jgi:formyltetrahydrofolate synthetase
MISDVEILARELARAIIDREEAYAKCQCLYERIDELTSKLFKVTQILYSDSSSSRISKADKQKLDKILSEHVGCSEPEFELQK